MNVYPFIEAERAQQRSVKRTCELLEVSRAAYYAHHAGAVPARQRTDEELTKHIRQAHQASTGAATAPHASTPNCVVAGTAMAANVWHA